jgi:uncharacterized protein (DUF2237 family)
VLLQVVPSSNAQKQKVFCSGKLAVSALNRCYACGTCAVVSVQYNSCSSSIPAALLISSAAVQVPGIKMGRRGLLCALLLVHGLGRGMRCAAAAAKATSRSMSCTQNGRDRL